MTGWSTLTFHVEILFFEITEGFPATETQRPQRFSVLPHGVLGDSVAKPEKRGRVLDASGRLWICIWSRLGIGEKNLAKPKVAWRPSERARAKSIEAYGTVSGGGKRKAVKASQTQSRVFWENNFFPFRDSRQGRRTASGHRNAMSLPKLASIRVNSRKSLPSVLGLKF